MSKNDTVRARRQSAGRQQWAKGAFGRGLCTLVPAMWTMLGATIDAAHAASMALWMLGLPLLFWHRWPKLSTAYGIYAVVFVLATRVSHYVLGECFLTTLSRRFWTAGSSAAETDEWFTVRFAKLIFGLTPSHRAIALGSEALIFVTAVGVLVSLHRMRRRASHA